jgi:hypothetical protein
MEPTTAILVSMLRSVWSHRNDLRLTADMKFPEKSMDFSIELTGYPSLVLCVRDLAYPLRTDQLELPTWEISFLFLQCYGVLFRESDMMVYALTYAGETQGGERHNVAASITPVCGLWLIERLHLIPCVSANFPRITQQGGPVTSNYWLRDFNVVFSHQVPKYWDVYRVLRSPYTGLCATVRHAHLEGIELELELHTATTREAKHMRNAQ